MFASRQQGTVIAKGLKIVGSVTAEGLVEVNGQIDGELHCTSLVIARGAQVNGTVTAERVVVDGNVEGPIQHRPASRAATCPLLAAVTVQSRALSPWPN
jgi:cytoskeletal protein CcmA (bactofilin family)